MKSHTCQISWKEILTLCLPPALPIALFPLLVQLANACHLLPPPNQMVDVDRTIISHQVQACRQPQTAQILFVGDSSCLMGVDTVTVSQQLNRPALNLGTLSFLDLPAYASLVKLYAQHNPGKLNAVVLVVHAEALRRLGPKTYYVDFLNCVLAETDHVYTTRNFEHIVAALGLTVFRNRVLTRILPPPLPAPYNTKYGFTADLSRYMALHKGGAVDPGSKKKSTVVGRYLLSAPQEAGSHAFKAALPPQVKLFIGITPVPTGFVDTDYPALRNQMLEEWGRWIQADAILTNLPATLPNPLFATVTHLSAEGRKTYTDHVVRELKSLLHQRSSASN